MDLPSLVRRAGRIHYAWIVAAVTFLTLLVAAGARAAPSVMIVPLGNEFQWSRAKVSAVISVNICLFGLVGPFAAALYHRFGLRLSMFMAMVLVGAGYGLSTLATSYWQFVLLWGVVVGLGSGTAATVLGAAVANRWFTERRGLVMGLLTASSATGQLIFLPTFAATVTAHGWRAAPLLVLGATAAILPVIWFGMRNAPSDLGLRPFGESGPPVAPPTPKQNPAREAVETLLAAMRVREFWLLAGSFFVCGASTNGLVGTHLVSAAFDCGISEVQAANLVAMMGIFDLFGTTLSGWLSDRMNNRYLLFGYYGLRGLSLLVPARRARRAVGDAVSLLGLLRTGLGGDCTADRPADRRHLWPGTVQRRLRLGRRLPSDRSRRRRLFRRRAADHLGHLFAGLHQRRGPLPRWRRSGFCRSGACARRRLGLTAGRRRAAPDGLWGRSPTGSPGQYRNTSARNGESFGIAPQLLRFDSGGRRICASSP